MEVRNHKIGIVVLEIRRHNSKHQTR
ncbi:hypothetical protein D029_0178A, partial [Vibrio parahaemolyticus 970107]